METLSWIGLAFAAYGTASIATLGAIKHNASPTAYAVLLNGGMTALGVGFVTATGAMFFDGPNIVDLTGLGISGASLGGCGTAWLRFRGKQKKIYNLIGDNFINIGPVEEQPKEEENEVDQENIESEPTGNGQNGGTTSEEPEPSIPPTAGPSCEPRIIRWPKPHGRAMTVKLNTIAGTPIHRIWTKYFRSTYEFVIRGLSDDNLYVSAKATGSVYYGFLSEDYNCRLGKGTDLSRVSVDCFNDCKNVLAEKIGRFSDQDRALTVMIEVDIDTNGDLVIFAIKIKTSIAGQWTVIPSLPKIKIKQVKLGIPVQGEFTDIDQNLEMDVGSWVGKCVPRGQ